VLQTTAASCALQLGPSPEAFFFCFTPFICYYTAHWQTFTTGALEFGMYVGPKTIKICNIQALHCYPLNHFFIETKNPVAGQRATPWGCAFRRCT
jgi:hypothetical protein